MERGKISTISVIGAGNVAFHLVPAMSRRGVKILDICNRTAQAGKELARRAGARFVANPGLLDPSADLLLISVSDQAVAEIAASLGDRFRNSLVAHTSGSIDISVLNGITSRAGVFYPLQTFRKGRRVRLERVPICIEAACSGDEKALSDLALRLGGIPALLDSRQRMTLHLAAVFSCNFGNFMNSVARDLMREKDIPFDLLRPLILQTLKNYASGDPFALQTGPAVREDRNILDAHREALRDHPGYRQLYELISNSIIQYKHRYDKL